MCGFCQDFGAYVGKSVNRFNLKENEQVVFQCFSCDEVVDSDMVGSNINPRVDG